ncbi:hypothetical protein CCAN2_1970016 [Capnocytophaga canimorsus]|nr:hypothetical protein CCAN2_1970016 [Capnocytophaga canimorsus]
MDLQGRIKTHHCSAKPFGNNGFSKKRENCDNYRGAIPATRCF